MTHKHPSERQEKKHDAEERRVEQISAALKGYYTEKEVRELLQQKREAEFIDEYAKPETRSHHRL